MPSLVFVCPVHGRLPLARICLRQLRRTCDALTDHGISASAIVVADADNHAELDDHGFGWVVRDNDFLSRRFNDGIDLALDPKQTEPRPDRGDGRWLVSGKRIYRGHHPGAVFESRIEPRAAHRALVRGDIRLLEKIEVRLPDDRSLPAGWNRPADYVVPIGSDDWADWRLFTNLPPRDTVVGFQRISFVREDGREITARLLDYPGGAGIRIYPRQLLAQVGFRPADEDRKRACDTSILTNVRREVDGVRVVHRPSDARQLVDWKTTGEQLNTYDQVSMHRGEVLGDPFVELESFFPAESLAEMQAHYGLVSVAA